MDGLRHHSPSGPSAGVEWRSCLATAATHEYIPTTVPYRANIWAMRDAGVTSVVAPCWPGSLQPDLHPGEFVVVDQLIDRTWGREDTFHDGPPVHHEAFADPYDHDVRQALIAAGRSAGITVHDGGTVVVIQRPTLQHPGRVPVVPADGVARGQHDELPGGGAGPGGGPALRRAA